MPAGQHNLLPFSYTMTRNRFHTQETFYARTQPEADKMVARWALKIGGVSHVKRLRQSQPTH